MSEVIQPGTVLQLPEFIDKALAVRLGDVIRAECEPVPLPVCSYGIYSEFGDPHIQIPEHASEDLEAIDNQVAQILGDTDYSTRHLAATFMNSESRKFPWHIDPDFDVRVVINMNPDTAKIILSKSPIELERTVFAATDPDACMQVSLELNPGDAYIIDNRTVKKEMRVPHATLPNSAGRLMLRYSYIYPDFVNEDFEVNGFKAFGIISALQAGSKATQTKS